MKMRGVFFYVFILLIISSCEKDFNINTGNVGKEVVVNSLWNDDGPMVVYLTQPYPIGATNNHITSIPDARVELYEDSVFKEVMRYIPSDTQAAFGYYLSNLVPQQGKNYTVKTFEPKYLNAITTDQIPIQAQLITSRLEEFADSGAYPKAKMYVVFRDNPAVQNYYRINVWIYATSKVIRQPGDTVLATNLYAMAPYPLSEVNDTVRDGLFLLFSDRGFNGQEKNLELSFNTINRRSFVNLTVSVELHTVSYAHYQYFQTLNLWRTSNSDEPVYIYSNVNNGLGDFVAEHIQRMQFEVK